MKKKEDMLLPVRKFGSVTIWNDGHWTVEKRYKVDDQEWKGTPNFYPSEIFALKSNIDAAFLWHVTNYDE